MFAPPLVYQSLTACRRVLSFECLCPHSNFQSTFTYTAGHNRLRLFNSLHGRQGSHTGFIKGEHCFETSLFPLVDRPLA